MANQVASLKMEQKFKKTPAGEIPVDWEAKKLGDLADIRYGLGQPPATDQNGVLMIRATNIKRDRIVENGILRVSRESLPLSRNPFLKEGDIIVVRSGVNTGDVALITKAWAGAVAGYDLVLSPSLEIDATYCLKYLSSERAQAYFSSQSGRSAQPHLNAQQLSAMPISLPSLAEQKNISEILSAVDEAIEKTNAVIENTRKLKTGLLQRLLASGIGHKKLKNTPAGNVPVDWECHALGDVVGIYGGGTPDRKISEYWKGSIPWATPTDVTAISGTRIAQTKETISESGLKNSAAKLMPPGSVLMTSRATLGYALINMVPMATNQGFTNFICGEGIHNYFLLYLLHSKAKELSRLGADSTFLEIPKSALRKLAVQIPPLREQKKIAEILSAVHDGIFHAEGRLRQIELTRRGLMQTLLTGEVRTA